MKRNIPTLTKRLVPDGERTNLQNDPSNSTSHLAPVRSKLQNGNGKPIQTNENVQKMLGVSSSSPKSYLTKYHSRLPETSKAAPKPLSVKLASMLPDQPELDPDSLLLNQPISSENENDIPTVADKDDSLVRSAFDDDANVTESVAFEIKPRETHLTLEDFNETDGVETLPVSEFSGSRHAVNSPISWLSDKLIKKVFTYLNPSDLIVCRNVQKYWNALIRLDEFFLENTVFVVSIMKTYRAATGDMVYADLTDDACLPFRYARFQYIDLRFLKEPEKFSFRNSDNDNYFPNKKFLENVRNIEFRSCFLLWKTIKAVLVHAVQATSLKITNCYLSDQHSSSSESINLNSSEFDEFNAGNAIFGLKGLEIDEMNSLDNITSILKKFRGYANQSLVVLKISYHPPASYPEVGNADDRRTSAMEFSRELKAVIALSANSLKVLNLHIQHELTLDYVGYHVGKELAGLSSRIILDEFQLSPGFNCWVNQPELAPIPSVVMSMRSLTNDTRDLQTYAKVTASSLLQFLQKQRNLQVLGLPCMEYTDTTSFLQKIMVRLQCPAKIKMIAVPSARYLPRDVFKYFPNLRTIKVGETCCNDTIPGWNVFKHYTKNLLEHKRLASISEENSIVEVGIGHGEITTCCSEDTNMELLIPGLKGMHQVEEISMACAVASPETFEVTLKNLGNLSSLEVNSGSNSPVMYDEELQVVIKNLTKLRTLVISCADQLTDFGLTGLPAKYCRIMFKTQKYFADGVNNQIWNSKCVIGRPLSDLKGLRKLTLMGNTNITDIGIGYGLAFQELRQCHLPYSDYITDWGIKTLGENNPSLDSLAFSGVNQFSFEAFQQLKKMHPRISKGDTSRSAFFTKKTSPFQDNLISLLPTSEDWSDCWDCTTTSISTIVNALCRPLTMEWTN